MNNNNVVVASDLPVGDLIVFADAMIKGLGVTSKFEAEEALVNISNDGRGIPFTKFCNMRNWNQLIAYKTLKVIGVIDKHKQVTQDGFIHFDGRRAEDIIYVDDMTLYNTPSGVLMVNPTSPSIGILTGEFVQCEESGYNESFRRTKAIPSNMKQSISDLKFLSGFKNIKPEYSPDE